MITQKQKENRNKGIFASDVARIMRGDSVSLVLEKMGELEPPDLDDVVEVQIGNLLEDKILDAYEAEYNTTVERRPEALEFFHPQHPWLGAHPDGLLPQINLEVKTCGWYMRREWGMGGDEVPPNVLWQTETQMACNGLPLTHVITCFIDENSLKDILLGKLPPIKVYVIPADKDLEAHIIEKAKPIWDCVVEGRLPPAEKPSDVKLIYQKDSGLVLEAPEEIFRIHQDLTTWNLAQKEAYEQIEFHQLQIKEFMQDAAEIRFHEQTLATWKNDQPSTRFDMDAFEQAYPELVEQFQVPKSPVRRFLLKKLK